MSAFRILGPVELWHAGERIPTSGPRQVALLAYLLLHSNRAVSREQLHEALWPGQEAAGAAKRVNVAVARLRAVLEPLRRDGGGAPVLRTVTGGYVLAVAEGELDASVFAREVEHGRADLDDGRPGDASARLRAALALWVGPALADVANEDFAVAEVRRLDDLLLLARELRIEADLELGRHQDVTGELLRLSGEHPEREGLCRQLMLALYRSGRQSEALETYQRLRTHLSDELGLEPGPALKRMQQAILDQAPWLDRLRSGGPAIADPVARSDAEQNAPGAEDPGARVPLPPALSAAAASAFVGRDDACALLELGLARAAAGERRVLLVCGPPGIGKTRLSAELAARAWHGGAVVLHGRCDEEMLLAHQPFVEALRHYVAACDPTLLASQLRLISGELRRLVPELGERVPELAQPLAGDPEGARHRLFEGVAGLLSEIAQRRPLLLVLDDLQWADDATLLLLKYVARHPRASKLAVAGTYRDAELASDHPLRGLVADLGREGLVERVELAPLDEPAVFELVGSHVGGGASEALGRAVFERTEGNPFFVVETLRNLAESGDESAPAGRLPLPESVVSLVTRRIGRLGGDVARVIATASVLGQQFELEILARLCGDDHDALLDALERAARAQLVHEAAGEIGRYAFAHALIRDVAYQSLSGARRARLHQRAGAAIEAASADPDASVAELAHHLGLSTSPADLDRAIEYATRAGRLAVELPAYEQAVAHFDDALGLLARCGADRPLQRCELMISRGEAELMAGEPSHRQTLLHGARLADDLGERTLLARAALASNRGFNSSALGVDDAWVQIVDAALRRLAGEDSATHASLLALLAVELIAGSDWRRRSRLADDAVAMARRVGDPVTLAQVLAMGSVARWPWTIAERVAELDEALRLADASGAPLVAARAAYFACDVALEAGDLERADWMLARVEALVGELRQPALAWSLAVARGKRATVTATPAEAEALAFAGLDVGLKASQPDAGIWFLGGLLSARFLRGTLGEGEPNLAALFAEPGSAPPPGDGFTPSESMPLLIAAANAMMQSEIGCDARRYVDVVAGAFDDLPRDFTTLPILAFCAVACARLGDRVAARRVHAELEPFAGLFVNTGGSWFGAVDHHLALLRAASGATADADAAFAAADAGYERLGADAWRARCRIDWARSLLERGAPDDRRRAGDMLAGALAAAGELDLPVVAREASELRAVCEA